MRRQHVESRCSQIVRTSIEQIALPYRRKFRGLLCEFLTKKNFHWEIHRKVSHEIAMQSSPYWNRSTVPLRKAFLAAFVCGSQIDEFHSPMIGIRTIWAPRFRGALKFRVWTSDSKGAFRYARLMVHRRSSTYYVVRCTKQWPNGWNFLLTRLDRHEAAASLHILCVWFLRAHL